MFLVILERTGGTFFCSYYFIQYYLEIPWPPHSLDITPIDFSVWDCVKDKVYLTNIQNIEELRPKLIAQFQAKLILKPIN